MLIFKCLIFATHIKNNYNSEGLLRNWVLWDNAFYRWLFTNRKETLRILENNFLKLDNQTQLVITENEPNSLCGNLVGTTTIQTMESYLTFHKDNFYQLSIGIQEQTTIKSDSCPEQTRTTKDYYSEYGSWTLLDKNVIFFQPNSGNPYKCTIVTLKKDYLSLDCSFRIWFSKPLSYEDYYTESMKLEAERISK